MQENITLFIYIIVSIINHDHTCASNYDTMLWLFHDDGTWIGSCDDYLLGYNNTISSTCTSCTCRGNGGTNQCSEIWNITLTPNTYFIKMGGFRDSTGNYSLSLDGQDYREINTICIKHSSMDEINGKYIYDQTSKKCQETSNSVIYIRQSLKIHIPFSWI